MIEWKRENNYAHSETDFVFCNSQNGAIEPRRYYQYYMEVMEEASIENANFHTLRHTFTTRCLEAGLDIVSVSKILGHAEVQITANTYTHLLAEHQKAEMQKIKKVVYIVLNNTRKKATLPSDNYSFKTALFRYKRTNEHTFKTHMLIGS